MIGTIALPLQKYFNMVYQYFVKPCHAEFILGNMKICWHFLSFLNIWMVRLLDILSCGRQGLTYPAWSRTWLLMTWSGKESEQQQSWFRLSLPGIFWSLQWRHNELDGVSNHQPHDCLPGTDQRKHRSSASLAFVRGIHRWPVNSPHKGPVTWKMFPFDDFIMFSTRRVK